MIHQGTNLAIDPTMIKHKSILKKKDSNKAFLDGGDAFYKKKPKCPMFNGIKYRWH